MKRSFYLISTAVIILTSVSIFAFLWSEINSFLDIKKVLTVPQSTIMYDRDGQELFRFFDEDRDRITYEQISPYMIDAIIAVEDQTFRENNGTDKGGLIRAIRHNITVRQEQSGQLQGGSTITQQLVKNIYLTTEKTLSRKFQELILAQLITTKRRKEFQQQGLSKTDAKREAKKEIISAYLNYVFFGNHAYGIEAAAKNYFQTSASQLTLLQSALLASLPQAPSTYNPAQSQELIMGFWLLDTGTTDMRRAINEPRDDITEQVLASLTTTPFKITTNCLENLISWASSPISSAGTIIYQHGRKDRVLCRLYETNKINEQELKDAFLSGVDITFFPARYAIRAPHFVFWVEQYLRSIPAFQRADFTYEQISQGGYSIFTTLDSELQETAENALSNYRTRLQRLGGNNRALIHVDSTNGDVLSYVGSVDFYDESIHGQVNVLRSIRQVGSTLKPFVYAYLFTHYPFTIAGNIVDFPLRQFSLSNHDNSFRGRITLASALAGSRNLPVVRTFLALGGADIFVPYFQGLGFTQLDPSKQTYNYPLVLGANEATLTQLTQAYIQLSVTGSHYPDITPIRSIHTPDGTILYEKPGAIHEKIIPDTVAEMIWRILSDARNMPTDRRWLRNIPLDHFALKTGTSDIKVAGRSFPRDGISLIYTPTDVVVTRAGNTDGSPMGAKAFGGEINHYPLREYLQGARRLEKITDQPRITETTYNADGSYAHTDQQLTRDQEILLRRGDF